MTVPRGFTRCDQSEMEEVRWCTAHGSSATVHDEDNRCDWLLWALSQGRTPSLCVLTLLRFQHPTPDEVAEHIGGES